MNPPAQTELRPAPDQTEAAFRAWLRRLVTNTAELAAFDAGQVDAVMDRASGSAMLLPEAQSALHDSNRIALSALDALPGEVCVLDAHGVVVMANKAWRTSGTAHSRAGLDVRAGENIFAACRDVPDREREYAEKVATGLHQVFTRMRESVSCAYVCLASRSSPQFTLTLTGIASDGPVSALVTREWTSEGKSAPDVSRAAPRRASSGATARTPTDAKNRLLAELPAREFARFAAGLESVQLTYGEILYEPGEPMREVYFPSDCLVSLLTLVEGHRALEVGLVGREGMIGARLALGAATSSVRALVQGTGMAMRMDSARFLKEFRRSPVLQRVLFQFTDTLMIQISQTAACNRFHIVEARLARWLLMTAERMASNEFHLTHEFLADMLGVRREGVTVAASALAQRKLISYRRGNITILDIAGLEASSCACYRYVRSVAVAG
ncbi:MAG TPA: Crp/Fnr family transcriptional regulator [Steroidobacteraceae bacterium]|jgi:CRP-like cAMP-binding protein|nr:Crp/Fnr family transcriptional regulator [Steroidobacteraceae bacterium]